MPTTGHPVRQSWQDTHSACRLGGVPAKFALIRTGKDWLMHRMAIRDAAAPEPPSPAPSPSSPPATAPAEPAEVVEPGLGHHDAGNGRVGHAGAFELGPHGGCHPFFGVPQPGVQHDGLTFFQALGLTPRTMSAMRHGARSS